MNVSAGICAYNEEQNIEDLLKILKDKSPTTTNLDEIIVVASGCTDNTVPIINKYSNQDRRIKLLTQERREGKASAVNLLLKNAKNRILILISADVILKDDTLDNLLSPLKREDVGMVGARIIPTNDKNSFIGYAVHLQWHLHHLLNLKEKEKPKVGEIAAFKKIFERIPYTSAVDEANIEPLILGQGYKIVYNPKAIIYNRGPENVKEFIRQRRRIYAGHAAIKRHLRYQVNTYSGFRILITLIKNLELHPKFLVFSAGTIILEAYSRLLGLADYYLKTKDHTVWEISKTTKSLNKANIGKENL